jgi:protein TonB
MAAKLSSWTVSVGAHLCAAALLVFGLPFWQKPIQAEEKFQGIEVLLMASAPPAPAPPQPVVEHVPPPPPAPLVKEPELITSTSSEPDLEPVPPPKPKPVIARPPKPQPPKQEPPKQVVEAPPTSAAIEPVPQQVTAAPPAPPASTIAAPRAVANPDAEASYYATLLAWLERNKEYPRRAQLRRMEGVAHLRFTIDEQGRVVRHTIERSSGHDTLDDAVKRMIAKASPLPPIPSSLGKSSLDIEVPVQFFLK